MQNKYFIIDPIANEKITYDQLFKAISENSSVSSIIYNNGIIQLFVNFLCSLINDEDILLLDREFEATAIPKDILDRNQVQNKFLSFSFFDFTRFKDKIISSKSNIIIPTSGTTGQPKFVKHTLNTLLREVRISDKYKSDNWLFAYSPTHIAGIQVFLQCFLNQNTLINCFGLKQDDIDVILTNYNITNISATPTFYRLNFNIAKKFPSVKAITLGGEKSDTTLHSNLKLIFPNANLYNIYASTEGGTLFASSGINFKIPRTKKELIKIENEELLIHKSLLGQGDFYEIDSDWYSSGDLVEWVDEKELEFRFLARKNEMINIGGNKVNPTEIESLLLKFEGVIEAKVFGKSNSLIGNILVAEILRNPQTILSEVEIKKKLNTLLPPFKVPRLIKFVENILTTRTGKLKR